MELRRCDSAFITTCRTCFIRAVASAAVVMSLRFLVAGGGPSGFRTSLLCLLFACQAVEAQAAPKRSRSKQQRSFGWSNDADVNQYATKLTDLIWPLLQNLGFSGIVGIVCAIAFKVELTLLLAAMFISQTNGRLLSSIGCV